MVAGKKIETLSPKQELALAAFRSVWFKIGTSTDRADRQKAEAAILAMRGEIGVSTKPTFIWCQSPATSLLAMKFIKSGGLKEIIKAADSKPALGGSLRGSLRDSLRDSLRGSLRDLRSEIGNEWWGQYDAYWIAFYLFCRNVLGVTYDEKRSRQLDMWRDIALSCSWWWCFENFVVISERPITQTVDERERIHGASGPAIAFADGWEVHAWHGVRVPKQVIEAPATMTVAQIEGEKNTEVRRVMLERYGAGKFLIDSGAKEIAKDQFGILYSKNIPGEDEPLTMVRVLNSTPENEGEMSTEEAVAIFGKSNRAFRRFLGDKSKRRWKAYFLRVHPECRPLLDAGLGEAQKPSAHNAVASTFGLLGEQYWPELET